MTQPNVVARRPLAARTGAWVRTGGLDHSAWRPSRKLPERRGQLSAYHLASGARGRWALTTLAGLIVLLNQQKEPTMYWTLHSITHDSVFPQQFPSAKAAIRRAIACGFRFEEFLVLPASGNAWKDYQNRIMFCIRSNREQ